MDISLSEVSEFYYFRLIESLFHNRGPGTKFSTSMDASLYVQVHSFFLHFGAARDYLGALIAMRLGLDFTSREGDSLVAVLTHLSKHGRSEEPLISLLERRGLIEDTKSGWRQGAWLSRMTKARNDVVHHRPYGRHECERNGTIYDVHIDWGIRSYRRGIFIEETEQELLDTLSGFYRDTMILFRDIARASGYLSEPPVLTDADLVRK